ncbi:Cytosolic carboxypeptidase 3 [Portunus trituberculatus]|uniref:Cytosolic carboxypeptidase 3 n=1 Tax=Portunus trituberculatus TaxID=210409 RepID=A0A5B7K4R7_PORTR|nr:Cytosolic carboxypeptidase 3 [Portunus trituberculatus]
MSCLLIQIVVFLQNDPFKASVCRQRVLCRSLAGNPVYLLTITSHDNDDDSKVSYTARASPLTESTR